MKLLIGIAALIAAVSVCAEQYEISPKLETSYSEQEFRNNKKAPQARFFKEKDCSGENCSHLNLGNGSFSYGTDAKLIASARYQDRSYGVVEQSYRKSDGSKSWTRYEYHFANNRHSTKRVHRGRLCDKALATGISIDGRLICVNSEEIEIHNASDTKTIPLPFDATIAEVNNNLAGTLAIALVDIEQRVVAYTTLYALENEAEDKWTTAHTLLHSRSDLRDVLAVYPVNRKTGAVALYEFVNVFNRGVNLYEFSDDRSSYRVITNGDEQNWGANVEVFHDHGVYTLTAKSADSDTWFTYAVDRSEMTKVETYVNDNDTATVAEFMGGYGLQYNSWESWQSVGDDISTRYSIDNSLMHSLYVQGRIKDTQLSVKYLTTALEDSDAPDGSVDILTGLVDFNGFFKGADTLRLTFDWNKTNGTATYKSKKPQYCIEGQCKFSQDFESKYMSIGTLLFSERGQYIGFNYTNYSLPSTLGLESSRGIEGVAFDEDYEQTNYMFVIGRDAAAYAARYELDYQGFYALPHFGIGVAHLDFSDKAKAQARNGDDRKIFGDYTLALSGTLDLGYIHQRRWRQAWGAGYSIQGGLKAQFDWTAPTDLLRETSNDKLMIANERADLRWGPYLQFNMIF
ncbi:hypothetical protein [Vibrio maerlii]|uniref:hypothetical protein n=1 Tax=Vibrio maerlii TaxID=2231648 RepID=UPI000E3D19D2|nr:hypothetical protein [Vibrio maerlii]